MWTRSSHSFRMEKLSNCYRLLYFAVLLIFLLKQTAGCGSWEGPSTKQTTRDRPRVTEMAQELPTTDKITRTKRGAVPLFPPSTPQPYPPRLYPPPRYRPPPFIPPPSVIQRRRILGIAYCSGDSELKDNAEKIIFETRRMPSIKPIPSHTLGPGS
ncbi:unnamed protein product [Rodentolepis nana]|uniref:Extensin-like n=1 Tax=Rodentolepis nana TaxID=102285 RepID=A0A0R3TST4_RODNA|nr:unnamed protein product [Rodentolepis nana]